MTSEQAFEILGIHDRNMDEASLKKAFYSAARRTHPDSNPEDENAKAKFHMINEAYDVLCEYLKYENKQKEDKNAYASAGYTRTGEEKDVWEAYQKADQKYAKKRHSDASAKAEETIRNHAKHEREKIKREQEAARKEEARKEAARKKEEENRRKQEQEYQEPHTNETMDILVKLWGKNLHTVIDFLKAHIWGNQTLKRCLFVVLLLVLAIWAGLTIFGAVKSITDFAQVMAGVAKWILIIWITYKITFRVQKNWKNKVLSTFAFLVSMELELILMNGIENLVRSLHL